VVIDIDTRLSNNNSMHLNRHNKMPGQAEACVRV